MMDRNYGETEIKERLSQLSFWEKMEEKQKEYAVSHATVRHYKKGAAIFGSGSVCLGMVFVLKGSIRISLLSEGGREIMLFRLEEGDPCVLSAACVISQITFETHMTADRDCDLLIISSVAFRHLTEENIYVKCFMYELMMERFSSVMWTMQQILFAKFDQRLAGFLLQEYEKTGSLQIRMTQEQVAQQINSAREVVARMLRRFVSDGLVEIRRGTILLRDIEGLRMI